MKRALISATVVFFFIPMIISCCDKEEMDVRINVGYLPMVSSLTHFVALEKGYYTAEGLKVEASAIQTSNSIAQQLVSGQIDAAIELSVVPLLQQLENSPNSAKIFSASNITSENGFDGILVSADSPITTLGGLSGKKVAVFPGTTAKNTLLSVFKVKFPGMMLPQCLELDPSTHIQALTNHETDALFAYEPTLTLGILKYGFRQISTSLYALQYAPNPIGVAVVNRQWSEDNPDAAESFLKAIDKAVLFIRQNPSEAREILALAIGIEMDAANKMHIMPMSLSTEIDLANMDGYLEILYQMGEISGKPKASDICLNQGK